MVVCIVIPYEPPVRDMIGRTSTVTRELTGYSGNPHAKALNQVSPGNGANTGVSPSVVRASVRSTNPPFTSGQWGRANHPGLGSSLSLLDQHPTRKGTKKYSSPCPRCLRG